MAKYIDSEMSETCTKDWKENKWFVIVINCTFVSTAYHHS